jgi:hypothetical protein
MTVELRRVGKGALALCPPTITARVLMVGTLTLCPRYGLRSEGKNVAAYAHVTV